MKARDFVYWLQGFFEINEASGEASALSPKQIEIIKRHLDMVFIHEIDPSFGDEAHQKKLDNTHSSENHNYKVRC